MHEPAERHAERVLVARKLDSILDVGQFLAEHADAGKAAGGPLHIGVEWGTEQIGSGIGEVVGLLRRPAGDVRAAERAFVARLAVAVVGHELRADGAQVVLDVFVEHRRNPRNRVHHHVFADKPVCVGKPFRVLVGRRVEQYARVLPRPRGQHDDARLLDLPLLLLVVVLDAGDAGALLVGEHARHGAERPHLGLGFSRLAEIGDHRVGERPGGTADMAPAVIDAGRASLEIGRVHRHRRRHHADAERLEALHPDFAVAEGLHRRHRIGVARRPPDFLRLGVARHADVARHFVVERRNVLIGDRPVERAVMLALDLVVVRKKARVVGEIVQGRTADAPAGLAGIAEGVLAFEHERSARGPDPPSPHFRADEVGELPIGPGLQQHDLLAGLGQHGCVYRAGCAGADDDDVYFFVRHVTTSSRARCGPGRGCRGPRSPPSSRTRHRQRRCAAGCR